MQAILDDLARAPAVDLRTLPIEEARRTFERQQAPWVWSAEAMAESRDLAIPGPAGPIRARLHRPIADAGLPVVLFAHGGGWTFGSIDTHDGTMRSLAAASGAAVLGIDYRLSPDHPFPGPLDDVMAALAFVEAGGLGAGCDATRIALAGDSAGANLALGALVRRRDEGGPLPLTATLFYGCYAPIFDTASHVSFGAGPYLLRTEMMRWYWSNFLGPHAADAAPAACAPLFAPLEGLPPLYLNAAGLDPLLDDTTMLSHRLASAGVRHTLDIWPGVVHGFQRLARELPAARDAIAAAGRHLRCTFNP
jgi:acetyl esterase